MNHTQREGAFPTGEYFTMVSHNYLGLVAGNSDTATDLRLMFLVLERVNEIGHAEFAKGELTRELGKVDADGVLRPMTNKGVSDAINRLVVAGAIKGGNVRCIQVSTYFVVRKGRGSSDSCHYCGINTDKRRVRRKNPDEIISRKKVKEIKAEIQAEKASEPKPGTETPEEPVKLSTAFPDASKDVPKVDPWDMPVVKAVTPVTPRPEPPVTEPEPEEEHHSDLGVLRKHRSSPGGSDRYDYEHGSDFFDYAKPKEKVT